MRFSGAHFEYDVIKLEYVDPDNNSDKFYIVVMDHQNSSWWAQYGRNGTTGMVTPAKSGFGGIKKAREKIDKGYEILGQGLASFATKPQDWEIIKAPLRERKIV